MYISILLILCKIGPWPTRSTVLNALCQTLRVGKEFGSDVSGLEVGKISFSEEDSCANDLLIKYSQKNKTTIVRGWGNMDLKAQANAHLQQSQSSGCSLTLQKTLEGKKSFQSEARVLAITPRKLKLPGTSSHLLSLEQSCCSSLRLLERRKMSIHRGLLEANRNQSSDLGGGPGGSGPGGSSPEGSEERVETEIQTQLHPQINYSQRWQ